MLVRLQASAQVRTHGCPGRRGVGVLRRHHERHRDRQPVLPFDSHHRRLLDVRVFQQALLGLARREPLPRDLEQVVVASLVGEVAVTVASHHVARNVPLAGEGAARGPGVPPVAVRARIAPYPHPADLAGTDLAAAVVAEPYLEAGDGGAEGAGTHLAGPVRDEDVPHLGRAEAIEELDAEGVVPAAVEGDGEGLAGGGGQPEAAQVAVVGLGVGDQVVHHRGDVDEDRGAVPRDLREELVGGAALGEEHRGRARREGEEEVGTGGVAEVELGDGERDVVGGVADNLLGVALGGVGEGGVTLDHALGTARGPAGEKPDGGVVGM